MTPWNTFLAAERGRARGQELGLLSLLRSAARHGRTAAELEGCAGKVFRNEAHRDRRALYRNQGGDSRLLAVSDEIIGRGDRMGQALPESTRGGFRDRDSSGVRGVGFRCR